MTGLICIFFIFLIFLFMFKSHLLFIILTREYFHFIRFQWKVNSIHLISISHNLNNFPYPTSKTLHFKSSFFSIYISLMLSAMGHSHIKIRPLSARVWGSSLIAQLIKNLSARQETRVRFLGWEDPLEKEMATHSSILAWRIPWREEPGGLQSMGLQSSQTQLSD